MLVERFVEQHTWPDSRKTAWLAGAGLPFQIIGSSCLAIPLASGDLVDIRALNLLNLCGAGVLLVGWLTALGAYRAGRNARWSAYLLVGAFASYMSFVIHGMGTWSTIFVFWIPLIVLLTALWFDAAVAIYALALQVAPDRLLDHR